MEHFATLIRSWCQEACGRLFQDAALRCQSQCHAILPTTQPLLKEEVNRFSQVEKNRFWILYYTHAKKKCAMQCRSCYSKYEACYDYVLSRILPQIKAFDVTQESEVFRQVRQCIFQEELSEATHERAQYYVDKIHKEYTKAGETDRVVALVENGFYAYDKTYMPTCRHHAQGHSFYHVALSPERLVLMCVAFQESQAKQASLYVQEEMMHCEKFATYIGRSIKNRVVDFTRSASYVKEVHTEVEEVELQPQVHEVSDDMLKQLNEEQQIIYALKYGFRLSNSAFLEVVARLAYRDDKIIDTLSSEEKFYIQLKTRYGLEDSQIETVTLNVEAIKHNIEKKIATQREKATTYSYREYADDEKKEIYLKLIYVEPLTAKEIGVIFQKTAKQIDKKIENAKRKLKGSL